jgi:hypothetical protein
LALALDFYLLLNQILRGRGLYRTSKTHILPIKRKELNRIASFSDPYESMEMFQNHVTLYLFIILTYFKMEGMKVLIC